MAHARSSTPVAPHDIVVFLGPSLSCEIAASILPARYVPPVSCGDILRYLRIGARVIAIIDGAFEHTAAVWHKEILLAMEKGSTVFGASSMGALRAAELAPFGMIGVGRIFESYRDGVYADDDEVAVLHARAAAKYRALSEPLVNIRATVAAALDEGVIAAETGQLVVACAKATFYQERSLAHAVEKARTRRADEGQLDRLLRFAGTDGYVDQKNLDALELITTLANLELPAATRHAVTDRVSRSPFFRTLQVDVACHPFEQAQPWFPEEERIASEAQSLGAIHTLLCDLAQLLSLGSAVARARSIPLSPEEIEHVYDNDDFGLGPEARDPGWAVSNGMDSAAFTRFIHRLAYIRALLTGETKGRRRGEGWQSYLLALLRVHGEYERLRPGHGTRGSRRDAAVLRNLAQQGGEKWRLFTWMAKLWEVVDGAAKARGIGTDGLPDELQDFADDFREARGLETRAATRAWLRRNSLDAAEFIELVAVWARFSILCHNAQTVTLGVAEIESDVCWFHDALRLTGIYTRLKQTTAEGHGH